MLTAGQTIDLHMFFPFYGGLYNYTTVSGRESDSWDQSSLEGVNQGVLHAFAGVIIIFPDQLGLESILTNRPKGRPSQSHAVHVICARFGVLREGWL